MNQEKENVKGVCSAFLSDLSLLEQVINGATLHMSELDPLRGNAKADSRLMEDLELDPEHVTYFDLFCYRMVREGKASDYDDARLSLLRSCADVLAGLKSFFMAQGAAKPKGGGPCG